MGKIMEYWKIKKEGQKKKPLNYKINMEICEVYGGMLVYDMCYVGMWYVICWYGDRYWKCGCFCQYFGKSQKCFFLKQ